MMKSIYRGLAIALALTLLCGAALAEVITTGNVWLRSGPGLSYDQVTSFAEGKTLEYLGESSVDDRGVAWYKVTNGEYTGWVSSKYSKLEGEEAVEEPAEEPEVESTETPEAEPVAEEPTAEPVAFIEPEAEPEGDETASQAAQDAGQLFASSVAEDDGQAVELSAFYLDDLVTAANEIGLIKYRQVESEVPYQYYDDAMILAGNQNVEHIEVFGAGYEVFGVRVGMSANAAMACLNAAGLDYVPAMNGVTYEHRGTESSLYVDENGHDSCVNLYMDSDNNVFEIDWSSYTG